MILKLSTELVKVVQSYEDSLSGISRSLSSTLFQPTKGAAELMQERVKKSAQMLVIPQTVLPNPLPVVDEFAKALEGPTLGLMKGVAAIMKPAIAPKMMTIPQPKTITLIDGIGKEVFQTSLASSRTITPGFAELVSQTTNSSNVVDRHLTGKDDQKNRLERDCRQRTELSIRVPSETDLFDEFLRERDSILHQCRDTFNEFGYKLRSFLIILESDDEDKISSAANSLVEFHKRSFRKLSSCHEEEIRTWLTGTLQSQPRAFENAGVTFLSDSKVTLQLGLLYYCHRYNLGGTTLEDQWVYAQKIAQVRQTLHTLKHDDDPRNLDRDTEVILDAGRTTVRFLRDMLGHEFAFNVLLPVDETTTLTTELKMRFNLIWD